MSTLELILYRLTRIEQQTTGLVRADTYSIEQEHLQARVTALESERAKEKTNARNMWAAVGLAMMLPVLSNLDSVSKILGG